jgi:hypothetical protein
MAFKSNQADLCSFVPRAEPIDVTGARKPPLAINLHQGAGVYIPRLNQPGTLFD